MNDTDDFQKAVDEAALRRLLRVAQRDTGQSYVVGDPHGTAETRHL